LTADNIEYILKHDEEISKFETKSPMSTELKLQKDIVEINDYYQQFQTSSTDIKIKQFFSDIQKNAPHGFGFTEYEKTLYPLQVGSVGKGGEEKRHWSLLIINLHASPPAPKLYSVNYVSSSHGFLDEEIKRIKPFLDFWLGSDYEKIYPVYPTRKHVYGFDSGVFLVFYIQEIMRTNKLTPKGDYNANMIKEFRKNWKKKIEKEVGKGSWCGVGKEDYKV